MRDNRNENNERSLLTLAALEVVLEDVTTLRLGAVLFDNNTRAADNLARVTLSVDFAETCPGSENLGISNLDQRDLLRRAEGLDEFNILGLSACINKHTKMGLASVQGLRALAQATGKAIVDERRLQDLLIIGAASSE